VSQNPPARYAWMDGSLVPWEEAKVHVETDCVKRAGSVFAGLRVYWSDSREELHIFRLKEHLDRLFDSAKIMRIPPRFTRDELQTACIELLARNGFREDVAMHVVLYLGVSKGYFGHAPEMVETGGYITAVPRRSMLESDVRLHACISSWVRISDKDMPPRMKSAANLQNSRLAAVQADIDKYDMAIMVNDRGKVAQGPFACVFLLRDETVITPSITNDIVESITRATVMELFDKEFDMNTVEREVDRTELYVADEVFCCGTGYEVTPIVSVDRYQVGNGEVGEITGRMRRLYGKVARGLATPYAGWLYPVYHADPNRVGPLG
jgi:branched-chain amino acid aminotransferase